MYIYTIKDGWLIFAFDFNYNLVQVVMPLGVQKVKFGNMFNQPVNNLPNTITHLQFGWNFNQKVNNFPSNLKYLKLSDNFDQNIDNLPDSIVTLYIGDFFRQNINRLPSSLETLKIMGGGVISYDIQKLHNLKYLTLINTLCKIPAYLPVISLTINSDYEYPLYISSVTTTLLILGDKYSDRYTDTISGYIYYLLNFKIYDHPQKKAIINRCHVNTYNKIKRSTSLFDSLL